jgi:hypothetical protein
MPAYVNNMVKEKLEIKNPVSNKNRDLVLGILFDLIGMMSFTIPLIGEFSDVVWAPVSGFLMVRMYKGTAGKVAGIFSFLEEILPFTDVIPSFTLMWIYTYLIKKQSSR